MEYNPTNVVAPQKILYSKCFLGIKYGLMNVFDVAATGYNSSDSISFSGNNFSIYPTLASEKFSILNSLAICDKSINIKSFEPGSCET